MKILVFLFFLMFSIVIHASPLVSESLPVNRILMIEKLAKEAQVQLNTYSHGKSFEEEQTRKTWLKDQLEPQIEAIVDEVSKPSDLYIMAILLQEGYAEFFTSLRDQTMARALEYVVMRLAQLGTEEAYNYFIRLKKFYGRDGGEAVKYRVLEFKYLKQYSKDPRVLQAKSANDFI